MDYRISVYTVIDDNGNEIECDAVVVNDDGEWAAVWQGDSADHVTFDGIDYIPAPNDWRTNIQLWSQL